MLKINNHVLMNKFYLTKELKIIILTCIKLNSSLKLIN